MRTIFLSMILVVLPVFAFSQNILWEKQFGGIGDDRTSRMIIDNNGDILVTGTFMNTVDFDLGAGVTELTSNGWWDVFLAKYDTTGNLIWAVSFGSIEFDYSNTITVDDSNHIYLAGNYGGIMDIDPGTGLEQLIPVGLSSYILKLNAAGEFQWARNLTGNDIRVQGICVGPQGVVVGGYFTGTCEFDNEGTSYQLTSDASQDTYVMFITENGTFINAYQIGSLGQNSLRDIDLDNDGNIYLTSEFTTSIDVDPGSGETQLTTSNLSGYGNFLAKYSPTMNLIWAKQPEFPSYSSIRNIEVFSNDEIMISGEFQDSIRFNQFGDLNWYYSAGQEDHFIGKINASGALSWLKVIGNEDEDDSRVLHVDNQGNTYVSATFTGTIDANPGSGYYAAEAVGSYDTYILRLDNDGNFVWFFQDSVDALSASIHIAGLISGLNNDLYVNFNFYEQIGIIQNSILHTHTSAGDFDALLVKMKADNFLSLEEKSISFHVYPNPTNGNVTINMEKISGMKTIQLFDLAGNIIQEEISDETVVAFRLNAKAGCYILRITHDDNLSVSKRLIVH